MSRNHLHYRQMYLESCTPALRKRTASVPVHLSLAAVVGGTEPGLRRHPTHRAAVLLRLGQFAEEN